MEKIDLYFLKVKLVSVKVGLIASKDALYSPVSNSTGVGRYAQELKKRLKQIVEIKEIGYDYSSLGKSIISLISSNFRNYEDFDIIHLLEPKLFFPLRKRKFIITVHDLFFLRYKESKSFLSRFYTKTISYADAVIVVSSLTREEVKQFNENVYVVNPGIDERFFSIPKIRHNNKTFKFGYVGRIDGERKNVLRGIQVFKKFKEEAIFELWGPYNKKSEITKRILREIDHRIKIMGPFQDSDIVKIYDSFDTLFLPSIEEGFGFPILEAQARGIPVIVFKDAKIPEEVCKYCIKIEDELPSLNELTEFKEKYSNLLIDYTKNFTWERTVIKTYNVYKELV